MKKVVLLIGAIQTISSLFFFFFFFFEEKILRAQKHVRSNTKQQMQQFFTRA